MIKLIHTSLQFIYHIWYEKQILHINKELIFKEIYNEVIKDLLNPNAGVLDMLEDERGNVQVPGLSRVKAPNTNRIMQILQEGNSRRTQEPTAANKNSSRSHALLQVNAYIFYGELKN